MSRLVLYSAILAWLTVLSVVLAQELPQITEQILPEIKRVGTIGYLNCSVTRRGKNSVYWIHRNSAASVGQGGGTTITIDDKVQIDDVINRVQDGNYKYSVQVRPHGVKTTFTLIIRRLEMHDAGNYTCKVHVTGQKAEDYPSKDGLLTVLVPPTIIQARTTQTVDVRENDSAILTCDGDGYPTPNITWVRANGKPLPAPINKFSYKGKSLHLTTVNGNAKGVYRCIADNAVRPPATYDATLYVHFTPFARPVQTTYGQAENRMFDITIECIVAGYPLPDLRWYKMLEGNKVPIKDDDKHVIHVLLNHGQTLSASEVWYQLTIINVQANDYGNYMCEGTNRMGSHGAIVNLYATSECQGANCPEEAARVSGASPVVPVWRWLAIVAMFAVTVIISH